MNEVMAILELWIKSSKSMQEIDMKASLAETGLFQIVQEAKNMKGSERKCILTHSQQECWQRSQQK